MPLYAIVESAALKQGLLVVCFVIYAKIVGILLILLVHFT